MRLLNTDEIESAVYRAALHAGVNLTDSCRAAMSAAYEGEI